MKIAKAFFKTGCLLPAAIVFVGLFAYFIWSTFLAARFSALGACDADAGCLYTAFNGNRQVQIVGFSADDQRFLSDGTNDAVLHDAKNGRRVGSLDEGPENHSYVIAEDGQEILAYRSDVLKFFDWDGELLRTWTPDEDVTVRAVATVPLVNGFVTAGKNGVALWKMVDGNLITELSVAEGFNRVAASTDGEYVAAYNFTANEIQVWPLQRLDDAIVIQDVEALSLALSEDGSLLAAGGPTGGYVWQTATGQLVAALEPDGVDATVASLNEAGTLLAVGLENGDVAVLDIATDEVVSIFLHEYPPNDIAFSPTGDRLAVGLDFDVEVSGGEPLFRQRVNERQRPGANLRMDRNRVSVQPGYAVVWSLSGSE